MRSPSPMIGDWAAMLAKDCRVRLSACTRSRSSECANSSRADAGEACRSAESEERAQSRFRLHGQRRAGRRAASRRCRKDARVVAAWLTAHGAASKVTAKGYGKARPIAGIWAALNRRTRSRAATARASRRRRRTQAADDAEFTDSLLDQGFQFAGISDDQEEGGDVRSLRQGAPVQPGTDGRGHHRRSACRSSISAARSGADVAELKDADGDTSSRSAIASAPWSSRPAAASGRRAGPQRATQRELEDAFQRDGRRRQGGATVKGGYGPSRPTPLSASQIDIARTATPPCAGQPWSAS